MALQPFFFVCVCVYAKYSNEARKTNSHLTSSVQAGKAAACCMAARNAPSSPRATARANSSFPRTMSPSKSVPANSTCSISPPSIPLSRLGFPSDLRVCPTSCWSAQGFNASPPPQPDASGRAPNCGAALFLFFFPPRSLQHTSAVSHYSN